MKNPQPTFPPLLCGHGIAAGKNPVNWAKSRVGKGKLHAGDLVWSEEVDRLSFAIVLEPEVQGERCGEMLFAAMVAFGDAVGALCPPEISITYQWPSIILMNDAKIGFADLVLSEQDADGLPDWLIVGMDVVIRPSKSNPDPGYELNNTTMWDEGCGDLSRTQLLESVARHTVNWIHTWSEDGFKPIHEQWWARLYEKVRIAEGAIEESTAKLTGMDETGNAIIKAEGGATGFSTIDALNNLRKLRGENT